MKVLILLLFAQSVFAAGDLSSEPHLHPLDTFTTDTFNKGDFSYSQPPIPAPGYSFWGITDSLTMQLDYTAWIGGVPSVNLRYQLTSNKNIFQVAIEGMYIYLKEGLLEDMDENDEELFIYREGAGAFARLNTSLRFGKSFKLFASYGHSYAEHIEINNEDPTNLIGENFDYLNESIWQFGFYYIFSKSLMLVANHSYGETWLYFENRPRKIQTVYGFRWKPLLSSSSKFWKSMTLDLAAIFVEFEDAEYQNSLPIPIFPVLNWRW